jgi:hypothetical protein
MSPCNRDAPLTRRPATPRTPGASQGPASGSAPQTRAKARSSAASQSRLEAKEQLRINASQRNGTRAREAHRLEVPVFSTNWIVRDQICPLHSCWAGYPMAAFLRAGAGSSRPETGNEQVHRRLGRHGIYHRRGGTSGAPFEPRDQRALAGQPPRGPAPDRSVPRQQAARPESRRRSRRDQSACRHQLQRLPFGIVRQSQPIEGVPAWQQIRVVRGEDVRRLAERRQEH